MTYYPMCARRGQRSGGYSNYFWLAIAFVFLVRPDNPGLVLRGLLDDCDSFILLVRMQDAIDLGTWFGDGVARGESGHGLLLPWAHPMDALILALRAPLRLVMDPAPALFWAGVATAPLSMGLLGMLCAWAAAPMAARGWLWTAPIAAIGAPPLLNYGQLGFVTHHIFVVVCVVGAWGAAGRAAAGEVRAGSLTGMFVGLGIWVSPEATPYGMGAIGLIALSWLVGRSPRTATALAAAGSTLAALLAVTFLIDPPHGGYAVAELDRLSLVFVSLGAIVCVCCWLPRGFGVAGWRLVGAGAAGALLWLALFPAYLGGLSGLMTPAETEAFFGHIQEMRPLDTPGTIVLSGLGGALALCGASILAWSARSAQARWLWSYGAFWIAGALALAISHQRFSAYPAAAAAVVLPILLTTVSRKAPRLICAALRPALLGAFCCAPALLGQALIARATAQQPTLEHHPTNWRQPSDKDARENKELELSSDPLRSEKALETPAECSVPAAADLLAPYAGAVVMTNVTDAPEILYRTKVKVVGSLYHTAIKGYMRLQAAWAAPGGGDMPPEVAATEAEYVLACSGPPNPAAATLSQRLAASAPPAWLQLVAEDRASGWTLYRIGQPSP